MERLQEQCVIELGISGMYKHSTFHGLQAFPFWGGVIARVKKKKEETLIVLQEVACVFKYNNDVRTKKEARVLHCYVRC